MDVQIDSAKRLQGVLRVPGDKSIAHRALLCGALANGWTRITGVARGAADLAATTRALQTLGVQTQRNDDVVIVEGGGRQVWSTAAETIDCANSGTTMRLLMGALATHPATIRLVGDGSLSKRPMRRVAEPLRSMGANVALRDDGFAPLEITGSTTLDPIDYELPVASAQLKSALIFAALGARGDTRLRGALSSRDHTERMLPSFGAQLSVSDDEIVVHGGTRLRGIFVEVPGDTSSAAFWIAAAAMTAESEIEIQDVCLNPTRTGFIDLLQRMGARIETSLRRSHPEPAGSIYVRSSDLRGVTIEPHETPSLIDELPMLAVLATQAHGVTTVRGAHELRLKESDRIAGIASAIRAMGGTIETFEDGFSIEGPQTLRGGEIDPHGDHRIAMAAAIGALVARGTTTIHDAECTAVSYPQFYSTLSSLGGTVV